MFVSLGPVYSIECFIVIYDLVALCSIKITRLTLVNG